ncbi:UbiA family prenyltransferase [Pedobacter sp. P351]|uniref:UbiA family prenyltransferase n=1 Tax=Pedobacter superstes TaxID=3133441 RepID=UPI0030B666D9
MNFLPTKSALQHSRFLFSFFLLPVYVFAVGQVSEIYLFKALLVFVIWHLLIYPASNGYNSYFDKDEGSIALLESPPPTDKSLYVFSLFLDLTGIILACFVSFEFVAAVFIYGLLSKLYSHPAVRLKKYPVISFLIVFIFQGAFVFWTSYSAISEQLLIDAWNSDIFIAGLICSCLVGASYPLTQVYQHKEDAQRGDKTLSMLLGINGTFAFAAFLFFMAAVLMYIYWVNQHRIEYFWAFLPFIMPVLFVFFNWILKIQKDKSQANFKNMSKMTLVSGVAMLAYFLLLLFM